MLSGIEFNKLSKQRSSGPQVFRKKGVLKNFAKFTGKHMCQSLFFNKVAGLRWLLLKIYMSLSKKNELKRRYLLNTKHPVRLLTLSLKIIVKEKQVAKLQSNFIEITLWHECSYRWRAASENMPKDENQEDLQKSRICCE